MSSPPGGLSRLVTGLLTCGTTGWPWSTGHRIAQEAARGGARTHRPCEVDSSTGSLPARCADRPTGAPLLSGRPPRPSVANRESNGRFCKNASLLAKSLTFVSEVQPSHTCGTSIAPLSSGLPTFPLNVDPSQLILQFSKRANSMRVSNMRLQSVIGVSFSGSLHLPRLPVSTASKRQPLSHFGVSPCSLSCCLLVLKISELAARCQHLAEELANRLRVV